VLSVANHTTAEQIVITGENGPLSKAVELVKEKGGKAIPLKVSGAWHCDLMKNAVSDFSEFIEEISFQEPAASMLFNATGQEENEPEKIRNVMAQQLVSPVKWYDIVQKMIENGIDTFVEVGPKKVLSGLVGKSLPPESDIKIYNVEDIKSLNTFLEAVS
jgi:[acyl-carrier-protein] S-malonyltransferase